MLLEFKCDRIDQEVRGDDAVNDGQAEPGAFARLLGGVERLEDPEEGRRVDAVSRVAHAHTHPFAGEQARTFPREILTAGDVFQAYPLLITIGVQDFVFPIPLL